MLQRHQRFNRNVSCEDTYIATYSTYIIELTPMHCGFSAGRLHYDVAQRDRVWARLSAASTKQNGCYLRFSPRSG